MGADFHGGEVEANFHLLEPAVASDNPDPKSPIATPVVATNQRLDLILRADYTHAENRDTSEPLPRIPPFRTSVALDYQYGDWGARLEGQYAAHQDRHDANELPTDSYFLVNAALSYRLHLGDVNTTFYVKGVNLTDEEARQSTSILKDISPLAGRGIVAGIRSEF